MVDKYLSIITNFGCHYTCPYCIVKHNNIDVPVTTIEGLNNLRQTIIGNSINIVSVSGGGDPLHNLGIHLDWYNKLFDILDGLNIPLEIHTSYLHTFFPTYKCKRMVYHLRDKTQLTEVPRLGSEIVRVVFVVTDDMTMDDVKDIAAFVKESKNIDELSFRQMVLDDYKVSNHLHDELLAGHKKDWWYIQQSGYNLYYVENQIYTRYSDFRKE